MILGSVGRDRVLQNADRHESVSLDREMSKFQMCHLTKQGVEVEQRRGVAAQTQHTTLFTIYTTPYNF